MRPIRRGDRGPAVAEIRSVLVALGLLSDQPDDAAAAANQATNPAPTGNDIRAARGRPAADAEHSPSYDEATERAVRAFQQSRGLTVDGLVGDETWRALDGARWRLGDRMLFLANPEPFVGDDVRQLQERLLEMGFDVGRADGIFGRRTARSLAQFQREVGLTPDGSLGPSSIAALRRLGRKVVGGRPHMLREAEVFRHSGPALVGKRIIIDPGHGGPDPGVVVPDGPMRWREADIAYDLAARLEGRLAATGMRVHLTRGPSLTEEVGERARAALANDLGADLLISLHTDGSANPEASGVATYHFGSAGSGATSTVGERLAALVQREIVVRTGLRDCHTHAKTWEILRLTQMPAVRVEVGYLTSPVDRPRLIDPLFRERVVEAIMAAVQRMFYPVESDVPTGSIDVSALRAMFEEDTRVEV